MKFSIIIPVYNEEKFIIEVLNRVNEQKKKFDIEIIVSDDGSNDDTIKLLNDNKSLYDILISSDVNLGKGSAIKKGLENSKQLIVSSHERSGTHYLMNSIDFSFDHYSSKNFINLDYSPLGSIVNFHSPVSLSKFFDNLYLNKNLSIIKNHFHANFFNSYLTI